MVSTIEQIYLEDTAADVTAEVLISGSVLTQVASVQWDFGIAQVPSCFIKLNGVPPAAVAFNADVRVNIGFNGLTTRVFTGRVVHVNPNERHTMIECQGYSLWLDVGVHKNLGPAGVSLTFNNVTAEDAITDLMEASGVPFYNVDVPAWTIGTQVLSPDPEAEQYVTLEFETYGEAILKIGDPDGSRWMETASGAILVRPLDPIPSFLPWRTYFSMQLTGLTPAYPTGVSTGRPTLRSAQVSQQLREVKNQVFVEGVTYTQVNADGSEDSIDIEQSASAPSPWVVNFDGTQAYRDYNYPHELIDTVEKAQQVAGRLVNILNRLNDRVTIVVDGDPEVALARTIAIIDPDYTRVNGRYFVEAYSTIFDVDAKQFETTITGLGGSEAGGQTNISPFALFTHALDLEVIGDRVWAVITLDGSASLDGDGEIVSWVWSGDVSGSGRTLYTRVDPSVVGSSISVTLTVTDDLGATDVITLEIDISAGAEFVFIPTLFVAGDNRCSASPDGGITWNDQNISKVVISVAAKQSNGTFGMGWFGTQDGLIYRTTDYCATAPALVFTGPGSPIVHIWPDWVLAGNVWAVTRDGKLYRSYLDGAAGSWVLWDDLRLKFGLPGLIASKIATPGAGGVWVYCGTGTGLPLAAFDAVENHVWNQVVLGGELMADLTPAVRAANPGLYIVEAAAQSGRELAILLNSPSHNTALYYTSDGEDPTQWRRATGLPAKSQGRWLNPEAGIDGGGKFEFGFNDNVIYLGDVTAGVIAVTVAPAAMDVGDTPNHSACIGAFLGGIGGAHLIAAEGAIDGTIYKTWDRFQSIGKVRPATSFPAAPAGWNAKQIAISGAGQYATGVTDRIVSIGQDVSPRDSSYLMGIGTNWSTPVSTGATTSDNHPICLTDNLWFIVPDWDSESKLSNGIGVRSKTAGASWVAAVAPAWGSNPGVVDYCVDAGGRIWMVTNEGANTTFPFCKVWWSEDEGDTWHLSATHGSNANGLWRAAQRIIAHPSNQNIVMVWTFYVDIGTGQDRSTFFRTENARATAPTWTEVITGSVQAGQSTNNHQRDLIMLNNGGGIPRMIVMAENNGGGIPFRVKRSDDWGATWTDVFAQNGGAPAISGHFYVSPAEDRIAFVFYGSTGTIPVLYVSRNGGQSFGIETPAVPMLTFLGVAGFFGNSHASDRRVGGGLYFEGTAAATKEVFKLYPVGSDGEWFNLDSNAGNYPHALRGKQNLAVIPV